jgi:hypothetical protein
MPGPRSGTRNPETEPRIFRIPGSARWQPRNDGFRSTVRTPLQSVEYAPVSVLRNRFERGEHLRQALLPVPASGEAGGELNPGSSQLSRF